MSIVLQSSGGGSVTLQEPSTASNVTVTIPATTGTVMVSGNMPAFSAYNANAQTFANGVYTKVLFDTEEFDTNNCFASSTFTPNVAGYYSITAYIQLLATQETLPVLYKNGSAYKRFTYNTSPSTNYMWGGTVSSIYMNGTTDYLEFYFYQASSGASKTAGDTLQTVYMNGCMTRAA